MKKISQQGFTSMSLSCAVGNTPAFNLYTKIGWEVEGGETLFSLKV
jgi:ribosomal protein S18 acetylase RimI-like enzyme